MRLLLTCLLAGCAARSVATAPPEPAAEAAPTLEPTVVGFGSCNSQTGDQGHWRTIREAGLDAFVLLGDAVYADLVSLPDGRFELTPADEPALRAAWAALTSVDDFRALRAEVPVHATWDDHDYGTNDGGADYPLRDVSQGIFLDVFDVPADDPRRHRPGVYGAVTVGAPGRRVQLVLLDTRYFRSPLKETDARDAPGKERFLPDPDPAKTMLGEAQWAWLAEVLAEPADLRVIVSSIQVLALGHGWERWENLPLERQRLLDLIRDRGAERVVLVSGDRHQGALYRLDPPAAPYPLWELTTSSLNRSFGGAPEPGPLRVGELVTGTNYGAIVVDWEAGTVALQLRGTAGEGVLREAVVPLAALAPVPEPATPTP